jgi:Ca-activated chloride channel family protein
MEGILRTTLRKYRTLIPFYLALFTVVIWSLFFFKGTWSELWITADQQGYRQYQAKEYKEAAQSFENRLFKGAAYFKAGEFKKAKAVYMTLSGKEARYNLGNAEMMLGKYDKAIEAYEIALKIDPDFKWAKENMQLAFARKKMNEVENDGKQGVGELGADEIVYDNKENKGVDVTEEGATESSEQKNANWLDRIQTSPKSFLKNKFSYQYQMQKPVVESKNVK